MLDPWLRPGACSHVRRTLGVAALLFSASLAGTAPSSASVLPAEDYRYYFIGNSLTRGLPISATVANNRLKCLFEARDKTFFWTQDGDSGNHGFLEEWAPNSVLGRMAAELATNGTTNAISDLRFLIRRAGQYYVSGRCGIITARISADSFETIALPQPSTTQWYALSALDIAGVADEPTQIERFDAIDAVGLYFGHYGTANFAAYFLRSFTADIIDSDW